MFVQLFSLINIFNSWKKFKLGKTRKKDVVSFEYHIEDNIFLLHDDINNFRYTHKKYEHFNVYDSKKRDIFKADVSDRIVHQIIYDYLVSIYEHILISDSYSSRINKGHHKAIQTLRYFIKLSSDGDKRKCFVLKCDIKKYFDSVDQVILLQLLKKRIDCPKILSLVQEIVQSFNSKNCNEQVLDGKGIPLGNVTSQIFANIYLDSLDKYVKENLKCRFYVRYNDDIAVVSNSLKDLEEIRDNIISFVANSLKLTIPFEKTSIRKVSWGIDFLGYVILPNAVLLRDKTKGKMYSNVSGYNISSYLGMLKHCNSHNLRQKIVSIVNNKI